MSTVSRFVKKVVRSEPAKTVGSVAKSRMTWGGLLAMVVAVVGFPVIKDNLPSFPTPKAPSEQYVPAPSPVSPAPVVKPAEPVGGAEVRDPDPGPAVGPSPPPAPSAPEAVNAATPVEPCFEKRKVQQWQTYTYQQRWVGEDSGNVVYRPATGKKLVTTEIPVRVPCPGTKDTKPSPVAPTPDAKSPTPIPSPAAVVQPGTIMYGVKGLGGIGDQDAFNDFARARGYTPIWIDPWDPSEAQDKISSALKKSPGPYALYGFSLGAKTVRDFVSSNSDNPPMLVVTVGASSVVEMKDKFPPSIKVEHFFHQDTKHDVPGVFFRAPHTGKGNIQRVIADEALPKKLD